MQKWLPVTLLSFFFVNSIAAQQHRHILSRKESFFGLHFDFHATAADSAIGKTLTEEMVDSLLRIVKPDFIQVDSKGHEGFSSYPTTTGNPAPGFQKDPLQLFRKVTAKHNTALYVHYSGVFDAQAVKHHPEWAVINKDGLADKEITSVYGNYVTQLMIPQLKELSSRYNINGVWVDGDCWATKPDYSLASQKSFRNATGIAAVPKAETDSNYYTLLEHSRKSFLHFVRTYTDSIHAFNPHFQVASNWAFSSLMPEPVSANVDFLSGDLSPNNSVYSAAFEGRVLASQANFYKKPWDIMSWSFMLNWNSGDVLSKKSVLQLSQEAAEIIAMGGGFQCYFQQNHDASVKPWQVQTMKGIADFVRQRQAFCQYAKPVPQIALLYSNEAHKRTSKKIYNNDSLDGLKGVLNMLLDGQQQVEVLMEQQLQANIRQYPLVIVPEWDYLDKDFIKLLLDYANNGGKLVLISPATVKLFAQQLGYAVDTVPASSKQFLGFANEMASVTGTPVVVSPVPPKTMGGLYQNDDLRDKHIPAAIITPYGKGTVAAVLVKMGENYLNNKSSLQRDFINGVIHELKYEPLLKVKGSHLVHTAINKLNNKTIIHLINAGGNHADKNVYVYDELPALGPLEVSLFSSKPKTVSLHPGNTKLPYQYSNGKLTVKLPRLQVHSIIVVE